MSWSCQEKEHAHQLSVISPSGGRPCGHPTKVSQLGKHSVEGGTGAAGHREKDPLRAQAPRRRTAADAQIVVGCHDFRSLPVVVVVLAA